MSPTNQQISQTYIKIDGTNIPEEMSAAVDEVVVDTSLYLPDMFSIRINDPALKWMDDAKLTIGNRVEISGKAVDQDSPTPLTRGVIVALEPEFLENTTTITVRGYDKSHHLHRGKKTRVFLNATDSDIVSKIAGENGVTVTFDSTNAVHEHVFQDNQTDMEFIHEIARRNGYFAYVENEQLYFKRANTSKSQGPTLVWGGNLTRFQARFTSAGQVTKSEVRGWDMKNKQAVTASSSSPVGVASVNGETHGGKMANKAFSISGDNIQEAVHHTFAGTSGEATTLAQSILNERCHTFFQAEGECLGNPAVRAGKEVKLEKLGTRFSGKYLVTRAVHRVDNESGYFTEFEISGFRANTLRQLLTPAQNETPYGVVVGIVTNLKDPENLARVKVKFPTITETLESAWARIATPMAGQERGIQFMPEVNDEVLVAFEGNDINRPYIIGGLWNGKEKPPEPSDKVLDSSGKVNLRIIKSRSGHVITLDDTQGKEQITIKDKAGQEFNLVCQSNSEKIEIIDKAKQKFVLNSAAGGEKIEIIDKAGSKVILDSVSRSVSIESAMDLKIKATGKVQIDGQTGVAINAVGGNLDIKSNAQTNIQGMATSVQGTASAEVKSSGILTVQGSLVKIN